MTSSETTNSIALVLKLFLETKTTPKAICAVDLERRHAGQLEIDRIAALARPPERMGGERDSNSIRGQQMVVSLRWLAPAADSHLFAGPARPSAAASGRRGVRWGRQLALCARGTPVPPRGELQQKSAAHEQRRRQ